MTNVSRSEPQPSSHWESLVLGETSPDQLHADVVAVALHLVVEFASLYASNGAFIELFSPIGAVLSGARVDRLHASLQVCHALLNPPSAY